MYEHSDSSHPILQLAARRHISPEMMNAKPMKIGIENNKPRNKSFNATKLTNGKIRQSINLYAMFMSCFMRLTHLSRHYSTLMIK